MTDSKLKAILARILQQHRAGSQIEWVSSLSGNAATRDKLPLLQIHVGPTGGVLTIDTVDRVAYHTTGGTETEPVMARMDMYAANIFPPGSEIPIDRLVGAVREFHANPGLSPSVDWIAWNPETTPVVYFDDDGTETSRVIGDQIIEAK